MNAPPAAHAPPQRRVRTRARPVAPTGYDHWYITAFLLILITPPELQFSIGTLVLSPQRIMLTVGILPAMWRVASDRRLGLKLVDFLVIAHVFWAWIAVAKVHGINASIEPGGSYLLEFLGSYMIGRALMCSLPNMQFFAKRHFLIVAVLILFTVPEAFLHHHYIRDAFGALIGSSGIVSTDPRLGLTRAFGPFDHPILYGVFCASALGFAWYLAPTKLRLGIPRLWRALVVVLATFVSVSSGPLLACTAQLGIIAWDVVTRGIQKRWWALLAGLAFMYGMLDALSNRGPLTVFISYMTFNPTTGYNRKLIWEWGMEEVRLNPVFGIGFNVWTTPPAWWHGTSVDAFWLVTAMRYGIPGAILMIAPCLITILAVTRVKHKPVRPIAMAWIVSFLGLCTAAVAVHYWGSVFMLFAFLLGMGVSITTLKPPPPRHTLRPKTQRPHTTNTTS